MKEFAAQKGLDVLHCWLCEHRDPLHLIQVEVRLQEVAAVGNDVILSAPFSGVVVCCQGCCCICLDLYLIIKLLPLNNVLMRSLGSAWVEPSVWHTKPQEALGLTWSLWRSSSQTMPCDLIKDLLQQ